MPGRIEVLPLHGFGDFVVLTDVAHEFFNKSTVPSFDPLVITAARIVDIEHYAPNDRVNLNLDYDLGKIRASLRANYYGSFRNEQDYPGQLFSSNTTVDAEFSYQFANQITASIGGRNIFDVLPDTLNSLNPLTGGLGDGERYLRTGGPFGYNGAFWYLRVGANF